MATKHKVNWHLDMGKKQHHCGDVIDLDKDLADQLVPLGVVTPLEEDAQPETPVDDLSPAQLAKLNKEGLADYAKQRFGLELSASELTKDAMLAAIAERATEE